MLHLIIRILLVCALGVIGPILTAAADTARIGVLAYRGNAGVEAKWLGMKKYLDQSVVGWDFEFVPITLSSADVMIERGDLDFIVTNPGHFMDLNKDHVMSVIASRKQRKSDGSYAHEFGSAIITRADSGITHLQQVEGRSIAAVDRNAFGGFKIAWREFDNVGLDLFEETSEIRFVGFPMDQILWQVIRGEVDVGIVRSGIVEEFIENGLIEEGTLVFLNSSANYTHPDRTSTRLYPEWPFAACNTTPADLRDRVALALLASSSSPKAAASGMTDVWTAPLPYHAVADLLRDYQIYNENRLSDPQLFSNRLLIFVGIGFASIILAFYLILRRKTGVPIAPKPELETKPDDQQTVDVQVTKREKEILEFISSGYSSKEIARKLNISPKTVEFHRSNLLKKYGAKTSSQLVAMST